MTMLPRFLLYGQGDPQIEDSLQSNLDFRLWTDMSEAEKYIALQEFRNKKWLSRSENILKTIDYLNVQFLRECPGKCLHEIEPRESSSGIRGNELERELAAIEDFKSIFIYGESEALVFRMLSKLLEVNIDSYRYRSAEKEEDLIKKNALIEEAFYKFDKLANCLNHIFDQFAINLLVTRNGLVPRQDNKIAEEIYIPTLKVLSNPKWKSVSDDLKQMFIDYRDRKYPEVITKAHSSVHRFLQILVAEEGKSRKGEFAELFKRAKEIGIIATNRFTEPIINIFQSFIVSERASNSSAKPALKEADSSDALLIMNVVIVFLQHCLQNNTNPKN